MNHIAICDDNKQFTAYLIKLLSKAGCDEKNTVFYRYKSGEQLVEKFKHRIPYDLLIVDMHMGEMDGNATAKAFRKRYPHAMIVFCSGTQEPTVESFETQPYRYWLKNAPNAKFEEEVGLVVEELKRRRSYPEIYGHYRKNIYRVRIQDILYIQNTNRGGRVIAVKDSIAGLAEYPLYTYGKVIDLHEKLKEYNFTFSHNSYLVNMAHIQHIQGCEIQLDSGEILTISRSMRDTFRKTYHEYIERKY